MSCSKNTKKHKNFSQKQFNCKNCSYQCAYDSVQLCYTLQHRTVLIIFRLLLQTIIIAQMSSNKGKGARSRFEFQKYNNHSVTNCSLWYAAPHLWNKLPSTLHVPYQFDPSSSPSSSPSSYSDPRWLVDLSRGILHSCLETFLVSVFPSTAIYPFFRLISWNLSTQCLALTGSDSHSVCGLTGS